MRWVCAALLSSMGFEGAMKKIALAGLLALAGCTSYPEFELPVAEIDKHAQGVLIILKAADQNQDGKIAESEWGYLGVDIVTYLVALARQLTRDAARASRSQ